MKAKRIEVTDGNEEIEKVITYDARTEARSKTYNRVMDEFCDMYGMREVIVPRGGSRNALKAQELLKEEANLFQITLTNDKIMDKLGAFTAELVDCSTAPSIKEDDGFSVILKVRLEHVNKTSKSAVSVITKYLTTLYNSNYADMIDNVTSEMVSALVDFACEAEEAKDNATRKKAK